MIILHKVKYMDAARIFDTWLDKRQEYPSNGRCDDHGEEVDKETIGEGTWADTRHMAGREAGS